MYRNFFCIVVLLSCSCAYSREAVSNEVSHVSSAEAAHDTNNRSDVADEILVTILPPQHEKTIVLQSDIRPGLDGNPRTLRDVVLDRLKICDAHRIGLEITEDEADQFLAKIQRENGLTQQEIEKIFSELGYTYEEGRQLVRDQQMIERIIDYRVRADKRFLVNRSDVVAYDEQHPQYKQAQYTLRQVFIPRQQYDPETVQAYIDNGAIDTIASWEDPFVIAESELAEEMHFIANKDPYTIVDVDVTTGGTEITQLVEKQERHRVSVDDRYDEIAQHLRAYRFYDLLEAYHSRLLREAKVQCTYPEDKKLILPDNEIEGVHEKQ